MAIFNFQEMDIILALSLFLLLGFLGGRLANRLKFPAVTGYIIVGLIIGPHFFGLVPKDIVGSLSPLTNFALGLIALTIGGRLSIGGLKKLGKSISYISIGMIIVSFLMVSSLVFLFSPFFLPGFSGLPSAYSLRTFFLPLALLLGAIAPITAPATTIAIINECKAKGPLTDTLLAVVAVVDTFGVMLFGVIFILAEILVGKGGGNPLLAILGGFFNVLGSVFLGLIAGWALGFFARFIRERNDLLVIILGAVMFTTGLASLLGLSMILANMTTGFILINKAKRSHRIFGTIAAIDIPIYVAFFVLAGAHFDWRLLLTAGLLGLVYLFTRGCGQILGAKWGAVRAQAPEIVRRYLGFGLIPQAGVAIGLVLLIQQENAFNAFSGIISAVVLAGVVANEIIGPFFAKMVIVRAGEAGEGSRENR